VFIGVASRFVGLLAGLVLVGALLPADSGQAKHAPAPHAQKKFAQAAEIAHTKGLHSKLPPHISTLLGLSREAETAVLQGVVRSPNQVQGIDVSATNKEDVVLFDVDAATNDQVLYLTSPEGTLRKVVKVKAGVGEAVRISPDDKAAFEKEKQFWVDRLVTPAPAK
jgi:hypothetical protein